MRLFLVFLFLPILAWGQPTSGFRVALAMLEQSGIVEGTRAGQIPLSNAQGTLRYAQYVEIDPVQLSTTPIVSGNTANFSEFVTGADGNIYYIDWQGRALRLSGIAIYGPHPDQSAAGAAGIQTGQLFYTGYNSTVYPAGLVVRKF